MKANTAVCLILLGTSLLLLAPRPPRDPAAGMDRPDVCGDCDSGRRVERWRKHVTHLDFGIDQLLFREPPGAVATSRSRAHGTAGGDLASCCAVWRIAAAGPHTPRTRGLSHWLAIISVLIASAPLIGYAYSIEPLYGISQYTGIALAHRGRDRGARGWLVMRSIAGGDDGGGIARTTRAG